MLWVSAKYYGKRTLGTDLSDHLRNLVVRLRGNGWHDGNVAHINPMLALQDRAVTVDVVEALCEVVTVFLGTLAQVAGTVALAGPSPSSLIKRHAEDSEVGMQFV